MNFSKQADIFSNAPQECVLAFLTSTRYPLRDRLNSLLSKRAGPRAREIAALKWQMLTVAVGELSDVIAPTNEAVKGRRVGRAVSIAKDRKASLVSLKAEDRGVVLK